MRKHEILYDWPIKEIQRLADSDAAFDFSSTLNDVALTEFTTLTEQMRGIGADLSRAKADRVYFSNWIDLQQCLESFERQFREFPEAAFPKFRFFLMLAARLAQVGVALDTNEITGEKFELRELPSVLPLSWFTKENIQSFEDSVAVFSCADMAALEDEFSQSIISPTFAFHLLSALSSHEALPNCHVVLVKKITPSIEVPALDAFVRLAILASGKWVHSPKRYTNLPSVLNPDLMRAGYVYHQWNEVLNVLSEYNSRDEVLLKYLTIYHIIENFMFKLPIVELERQQNGRMFSIRDFRRLYKQVDVYESVAIKRLFTEVLCEEAVPGVTFEAHIISRWDNLIPTLTEADIESALCQLGITKKDQRPLKHADFKTGNGCAGYFAQMVYAIRCAIVHNKETELHLTYASLDSTFSILLESFLLPSLEEICFALIGSPNNQVWYAQRELQLYQ